MDRTPAWLAEWMPRQRWYASTGRAPRLSLLGSWELPAVEMGVTVRTHLVLDAAAQPPTIYQVPVVDRPVAADPAHVIARPAVDRVWVDGPHDSAYTRALLRLITASGQARGEGASVDGRSASATHGANMSSRVLEAEQSNTSIIYTPSDGGQPIICKLYRQLHPGLNPDIELQASLAASGSPHVPAVVGWAEASWTVDDGVFVTGSVAFAQEFLPGVDDAWRVALHAAENGDDMTEQARSLGAATAHVHAALAAAFPVRDANDQDRERIAEAWHSRLADAIGLVPELSGLREVITAAYRRARQAPWTPLQRIHGDLHLGQVLHAPERGWVLLDFEGEPLRPMRDRVRPDLVERDIAGMLRSFDYVADTVAAARPDLPSAGLRTWSAAAREAFTRGFSDAGGRTVDAEVVRAFELDKAVYEAIYEARNRPDWLPIPMSGLGRLAT